MKNEDKKRQIVLSKLARVGLQMRNLELFCVCDKCGQPIVEKNVAILPEPSLSTKEDLFCGRRAWGTDTDLSG